jgi:hypothetical protein
MLEDSTFDGQKFDSQTVQYSPIEAARSGCFFWRGSSSCGSLLVNPAERWGASRGFRQNASRFAEFASRLYGG